MVNFTSISELLSAFSNQVQLPEHWEDIIDIPEESPIARLLSCDEPGGFWQRSYELSSLGLKRSLARAYKVSRAAAFLDMVLHNEADRAPQWYDRKDTELPKKSLTAHSEIAPILLHIAGHFERVINAHRNGKNPDSSEELRMYAKTNELNRLNQIGFFYKDLCNFFEKTDTFNPFHENNGPQNSNKINPKDSVMHLETENIGISTDASSHSSEGGRRKITLNKKRENILSNAIEEAIREAGNDRTAPVFLKLKEMALSGITPFINVDENGDLVYTAFDNETKTISHKQLSSRLQRRRKKILQS